MKTPDRKTVSQLEELPNIGRAIAGDLRLVGIEHPRDLIGKDPYLLFENLCSITGEKHDPCVLDVFLAVVDYMEGGDVRPWWSFTAERKGRTAMGSRAEQVNKVLFAIASAVNTTQDLDELYHSIHHSLGLIIDVTNFFIAIVNSKKRTLHFPYWVDSVDDDYSPITDFDIAGSLTGFIVLQKKPLLLKGDDLRQRGARDGIRGSIPRIWMGVPLEVRGEIIGVIAVQSYTDPDIYNEKDLELLTAVTDQVAIAIDRKQSHENLRLSEQRFRLLFEQSNDAIIIHDRAGAILDCNNATCKMLGYKREQLLSLELKEIHSGNYSSVIKSAMREVNISGHVQFETTFEKEDGAQIEVEISSHMVDRSGHEIIQSLVRDVTERKKVEKLLYENEKKYRNLFHNALIGLYRTHTVSRTIVECNETMVRMFGYDDLSDFLANFNPAKAYCKPDRRDTFFKLISEDGEVVNHEAQLYRKNGDVGWFRFSAKHFPEHGWLEGVVVDITEIKEADEKNIELRRKLERSKKMEALGLLAGGVAHDLNNILAAIISYPELMLLKHPDNHDIKKPLEAIMNSGRRGAKIVDDMLTIARGAASPKENWDLHSLITDYLESPECLQLKPLYPDIKIKSDLKAFSSIISCSPIHINKCLMNLLTNGVEAIKGSGSVILSTSNTIDSINQSENIVLSIQDTGTGISNEDIEHIFEPFYSKKAMGRSGTGLGLTVVWNSMADHDGKVTVENNEFGTCLKLLFPLTDVEQSLSSENVMMDVVTGQGESVLIVDDEPHIRDTTSQLLEEVGYTVQTVESGEMALDYLKTHRIDLVLLDMLMDPGINGLQTYTEIIKINPGQKAIIASGFSESDNVQSALQLGVGRFIKKPYSLELLSMAIREELDEK